jgi:SAM-dependent methyltransferase
MSRLIRLIDKSPVYAWKWYRSKRHTEDLMASMDWQGFEELKKYKHQTGHPHYKKYFNMPYWLRKNMQRVLILRLNRTQKRLKILDIGAGFGYFPYAAMFFGHEVVALDIPGDTLFGKACAFMEIPKVHFTIEAKQPLPEDMDGPFDLITAFQVCFNNHYADWPWGAEEWDYFLAHLFDKHLKPGGQVYLELNYHQKVQDWLPADAKKLFREKYKAQFTGFSRVKITKPL